MAWQWANTRKGYWRIAGSHVLSTTVNNRYLETLGFPNILKLIIKVVVPVPTITSTVIWRIFFSVILTFLCVKMTHKIKFPVYRNFFTHYVL